jgi:hypothetical protein
MEIENGAFAKKEVFLSVGQAFPPKLTQVRGVLI